ncbi:phenazine biosynthesis-like protein [Aspergillus varians]
MAAEQAPYVTLDVFSSERFKGNPVAIVNTNDVTLSQEEKQRIAKEFNFSETVFLHHPNQDEDPQISIFTPVNEMELAGHPVIGTGHYLFRQLRAKSDKAPGDLTMITKAGPVPISYNAAEDVVSANMTHNIRVHEKQATHSHIVPAQGSLQRAADLNGVAETFPVVSMVKGVTYALVDLSGRPDLLDNLVPGPSPKLDLDDGWAPSFTGVMYYQRLGERSEDSALVWDLRVRMIAIDLEDPACGSGSCSLSSFLALSRGQEAKKHRFYISQGAEMGRESHIIVEIELSEDGSKVSTIKLAGQAAFVAEGKIFVR